MDTVHCILVCVMCPPGQGCRSWYVMSNQKFNVPELVRLHERSTVHENSSITARWILEVIHYGLGTLVDFFSTTVTESSNGCRSCPRSTGSNSGIFHTSINLWTLGWFHWEGTWHNTSHIFTLFINSFVGRERAVKKYEFRFYARFHQHNQLLKSPASRFSFFRPILWIFWSYCRLYCVNANPSHYHQPHSLQQSRLNIVS
jgi:hypothetical protein